MCLFLLVSVGVYVFFTTRVFCVYSNVCVCLFFLAGVDIIAYASSDHKRGQRLMQTPPSENPNGRDMDGKYCVRRRCVCVLEGEGEREKDRERKKRGKDGEEVGRKRGREKIGK